MFAGLVFWSGFTGRGREGVIRCFCGGLVGYVWFTGWSLLVGFAGSSLLGGFAGSGFLGKVCQVRFAGLGSSGSCFQRKYI